MQRRLKFRIWRGYSRPDALPPRKQLVAELVRTIELRHRKVIRLAAVIGKVVELDASVLELLDQLPITFANRAGWPAPLVRVVREMPIQRAGRQRLPAQQLNDAHTIKRPDGLRR